MSHTLIECFSELEDPRIERNKCHQLIDIVVLAVCAMVSGAKGWEEIAGFGEDKIDWLRQYVPLANGIPSHDCISYVFQRISPAKFTECFINWTDSVVEQLGDEFISIDGKTARGSRDKKNNRQPLHMVSAWASKNRLVLGQSATDEKSNEITAIPKLLDLLEIKGCIITIDAMGYKKEIAKKIKEQQGDYIFGLKGNQEKLSEAVEDFFTVARQADFKKVEYQYFEETDKGHGRLETRRYWITECLETLPTPNDWKGLTSIGMVERESENNGKHTIEQRYFICSIPAQAERFAAAVRGHWGIENQLHWRLDVSMNEDKSRIRKNNAPAIMTSLRHLCLGLFEREGSKRSVPRKMQKAALNDAFRAKVVFS